MAHARSLAVGVVIGISLGAAIAAIAQPDLGGRGIRRWSCPSCQDIDVPEGSAVDDFIVELQQQVADLTGSKTRCETTRDNMADYLVGLGRRAWNAAAKAAIRDGKTYADPESAAK